MTPQRTRLFNRTDDSITRFPARPTIGQEAVNRALSKRLQEKIRNYDREATKLEFRGQREAAQALRKAASQLKRITRTKPREIEQAS